MYIGELKRIDELIFTGKGREAYKALKGYLKGMPSSADANAMLAMVLAKHKPKVSWKYITKIPENAKVDDKTYYYIAMAYALLGEKERARSNARIGLERATKKKDRNLMNNIALVHETLADYATAIATVQKALELGDYTRGWHNLARFQLKAGRASNAIVSIERALALPPDPTHCPQWILKGEILAELGRYAEARECFKNAIELDTEHLAGYDALAKMYMKMEEYDKVVECCDAVLLKSYRASIVRLQKEARRLERKGARARKERARIVEQRALENGKKIVRETFVFSSKVPIRDIAFSRDGNSIGLVRKGLVQLFSFDGKWAERCSASIDGKPRFICASCDSNIWFVSTAKELLYLSHDCEVKRNVRLPKKVECIASIGNSALVTQGNMLACYDKRGEESWKFDFGGQIRKVFVEGGRIWAIMPNEIGILDAFGTLVAIKPFNHHVAGISFSHNDEDEKVRAAVAINITSSSGIVAIIEPSGKIAKEFPLTFAPEIAAISDDHTRIAILSAASDVFLIDERMTREDGPMNLCRMRTSPFGLYSNIFFSGHDSLVCASSNVQTRIIEAKEAPSLVYDSKNRRKFVERSHDGQWLAVVSSSELRILEVRTKAERKSDDERDPETPKPLNCT